MSDANTIIFAGIPVDVSELDFSNHSSRVGSVKTANIALIILVGLFVGLRLFVRLQMVRKFFADDVLIVVAAAFTIALASVCLKAADSGLGTHIWMFPLDSVLDRTINIIQYLYVCQVLYCCAIAFTKIAIIASYLRFVQSRKFRIAMYVNALIIVGLWFTGVFVAIFQCNPIAGAWDITITSRKCINFVDYLYASSAITVTTDVILCVFPWPYLWKLNMPRKQRVILCLLFGGGAGACIASIIRIANLYTLRTIDVTYESVPCLNLSVIECSLGIICVSIPALRPLAAALFPKFLRISHSSSGKSPIQSHSLAKRTGNSPRNTGNQHHHRSESTLCRSQSSDRSEHFEGTDTHAQDLEEAGEHFDSTTVPTSNTKEEEMKPDS